MCGYKKIEISKKKEQKRSTVKFQAIPRKKERRSPYRSLFQKGAVLPFPLLNIGAPLWSAAPLRPTLGISIYNKNTSFKIVFSN